MIEQFVVFSVFSDLNSIIIISLLISVFVILICVFERKERIMERMVGGVAKMFIETTLEQFREKIISAGLDRWVLDKYEAKYESPDHSLFKLKALIQNVLFTGASQFVTRQVRFDVPTSTVIFDVSIPKLFLSISESALMVTVFESNVEGQLKGWLSVIDAQISGKVGLAMDDDGNLNVSSVEINFNVADIKSKVTVVIWGMDFSDAVNAFLTTQLSGLINSYASKFKDVLEAIFKEIADARIAQMF